MGGGDLNMKKSWHPVLLVNQEKVWIAEKAANEEKKKLAQLRKEQEEERQLAELQRLQEEATGRKRVERLDWMYAAPNAGESGAMGGARLGEKEMEDYLLGKKRVDEVLGAGEKNIGALHREFIAVQNANSARDTASKIREDPLLAIKRQEQAALQALMNRPEIRKQLKAAQKVKSESREEKDERKARKKADKEERRKARHESKHHRHSHSHSYRDSRSPRSYTDDERDDYKRPRRDSFDSRRDRSYRDRSRSRTRSSSPRRERDSRRRDDSPRRYRDSSNADRRKSDHRDERSSVKIEPRDDRIPPPRNYNTVPSHPSRPSAMDLSDRPPTTTSHSRPPPPSQNALDEARAARLAAMSQSANQMYEERSKTLAQRAEEDRIQFEKEEKARLKYAGNPGGALLKDLGGVSGGLGLSESLQRRAGKGLIRDI